MQARRITDEELHRRHLAAAAVFLRHHDQLFYDFFRQEDRMKATFRAASLVAEIELRKKMEAEVARLAAQLAAALDALEHAKEILQKHEPKHRRLPYGMCRSDCPACAYIGAATHCADALEGGGR